MKRFYAVVMLALLVMGIAATVQAAGDDVIDKIRIIAIKKIAVTEGKDGHMMDVTITFRNENSKDIKFINGKEIVFSVGSDVDTPKLIGTTSFGEGPDQEKGPLCNNSKKCHETWEKGDTDITFNLKMGDKDKAFEAMKNLLNCIGDPINKKPYFTIKGSFELGIESPNNRGWTTARDLGIDWKFIPLIQKNVGFMQGDNSNKDK